MTTSDPAGNIERMHKMLLLTLIVLLWTVFGDPLGSKCGWRRLLVHTLNNSKRTLEQ